MVTRLKRLVGRASGGGEHPFTVFVVQHAEARNGDAQLGLSARGREQAEAFASSMKRGDVDIFVTGPVQASIDTAETMRSAIGGELIVLEEFGESGADEENGSMPGQGPGGVHDRGGFDGNAADRFLRGLDILRARYAQPLRVMLVSDGERTLNAVRSIRSDEQIEVEAPGSFEQGIPACAMTTFVWRDGAWDVEVIAALTIPDI